jgi:oxygen-independent coproporphyrinogen-3 oxidase
MGKKEAMVSTLIKELELRKEEFKAEVVQTIYFGGGTPSVLDTAEIDRIIASIRANFEVVADPEITLEANPDDLSKEKIEALAKSPINRLSIGIQSFFEEDLRMMNRAHNAEEAALCIVWAKHYFDNISIDLIYGIPGMSNDRWMANVDKALALGVPHISSYALTVEPKTALKSFIDKGLVPPVNDEWAEAHFHLLVQKLEAAGFVNYEISNFGRPGYFSRNNTAYWQGKKYLGIGPSAHSYNGIRRGWNINNNAKYMKSIAQNQLPMEVEVLSRTDRYNEYIMTGLRTIWGVSLNRVKEEFGVEFHSYLLEQSSKKIKDGLLYVEKDHLFVSPKGKFLSDGIAADLFLVNLS